MQVVSIQPTPNPNAYKFILDRQLMPGSSRHLENVEQARDDALATGLFAVPGVETLFFADNFVTVSTREEADFRAVIDQIKTLLESHEGDMPEATAAPQAGAAADGLEPATDDPEMLVRINDLLDDRVRPALAGDGGGLQVIALEEKTLSIRYQGACGTCPSSVQGTLRAIENLLKTEVDEALTVLPA